MLTFHRKNNFLVYHKSRARVDGRRGDDLFAVRARGYFAAGEDGHVWWWESLLVPLLCQRFCSLVAWESCSYRSTRLRAKELCGSDESNSCNSFATAVPPALFSLSRSGLQLAACKALANA